MSTIEEALVSSDPQALMTAMSLALEKSDASTPTTSSSTLVLEKLKDLLQKCVSVVSKSLVDSQKAIAVANATSLATEVDGGTDALLVLNDAQFYEPRGRFKTTISIGGILLEGKSLTFFLPWNKIANAACVPSNASTKKEGEDLLAFSLIKNNGICTSNNSAAGSSSSSSNGGGGGSSSGSAKEMKSLLWVLSKNASKTLEVTIPASKGDADNKTTATTINGTESHVVYTLINKLCGVKGGVDIPRKDLFSTTSQKSYLRCYKGTQEGALYPLKSGCMFVKPLLFIPTEEISSLTAGRGGGMGTTRYVDLKMETVDDREFEFTNIEREDLPALQLYVKNYLEARAAKRAKALKIAAAAANSSSIATSSATGGGDDTVAVDSNAIGSSSANKGNTVSNMVYDDSDDDDEDDDYNPDESDSSSDDDDDDEGSNHDAAAAATSSSKKKTVGSKRSRAQEEEEDEDEDSDDEEREVMGEETDDDDEVKVKDEASSPSVEIIDKPSPPKKIKLEDSSE